MVTAYTLTGTGEATGIVQAARPVGLPVAVSFTVETDRRLPGGVPLAQAIMEADAAGPDYFLVNCAYPAHIEPTLAEPGSWRERIIGVRYNASVKSHAELDQATKLRRRPSAAFRGASPAAPAAATSVDRRRLLRDRRTPRRNPVGRQPGSRPVKGGTKQASITPRPRDLSHRPR